MIRVAVTLMLLASPASALEVSLGGATVTRTETSEAASVRLPVARWSEDTPAPEVEGAITRTVLRAAGGSRTTLQLMSPLREQLEAAGFEEVFTCADRACGGFDFRFQLDLLGAPDMFVDLGEYRYLLMRREGGEPHTVSIVTSRSAGAGFVHLTLVGPAKVGTTEAAPDPLVVTGSGSEGVGMLVTTLLQEGHVVLPDLDFASGASDLGPGAYPSLEALGAWLLATPEARIALVGHTDSVGNAAANRALSERRARSVRQRLIDLSPIAPDRIEADGVGYLAPVAPNTTDAGRALNRRVEAVLLSTE